MAPSNFNGAEKCESAWIFGEPYTSLAETSSLKQTPGTEIISKSEELRALLISQNDDT